MTTPRNTVPVERTWDEPGVFSTVEAWEAELEAVLADLPALAAFQGRLGESASVLVEALHTRDELARRAGRVFVYAMLGYAVETTDPAAVARSGRAQAAEARVTAAAAFVDPEVLALGEELLHDWSAAEPAVVVYEHHVADLVRRAGHIRSAEVEEVLGHPPRRQSTASRSRSRRGRSTRSSRAPIARCGAAPGRATPTGTSACETPSRQTSRARSSRLCSRRASAGTPRCLAFGLERPGRGLRQPDRCVRGEPADVASLLARAAGDPRCRRARTLRRCGSARGVLACAPV